MNISLIHRATLTIFSICLLSWSMVNGQCQFTINMPWNPYCSGSMAKIEVTPATTATQTQWLIFELPNMNSAAPLPPLLSQLPIFVTATIDPVTGVLSTTAGTTALWARLSGTSGNDPFITPSKMKAGGYAFCWAVYNPDALCPGWVLSNVEVLRIEDRPNNQPQFDAFPDFLCDKGMVNINGYYYDIFLALIQKVDAFNPNPVFIPTNSWMFFPFFNAVDNITTTTTYTAIVVDYDSYYFTGVGCIFETSETVFVTPLPNPQLCVTP
ncbi:MAG: hypothetical protein NTU44_10400, partial [Bacteroidetes bacterium]|nr:hypothetical protein [Bacteroidota bacterium]